MQSFSLVAALAAFGALAACGGGGGETGKDAGPGPADAALPPMIDAAPPPADAAVAPPLRNAVSLADEKLAEQALALLGPAGGGCISCHGLNQPLLRHWRDLGDTAITTCLLDLSVATPASARAMLDCLRSKPSDPSSAFVTAKLGPFSAAAHLPWFAFVFQRAFGDAAAAKYDAFKTHVGMPQGASHTALTQGQFDIVAEWFARNLPLLDVLVPADPPPTGCIDSIKPEVATHAAAMKQAGWGALNAEHHVLMFGCGGATDPRACLSTLPRAGDKPYGAGWESLPGAKLRVLRENDYDSSFWTRSSADGRFVAHGGGPGNNEFGSSIIDLQQNRVIPANASYDPGFFPDNSGFVFQGGAANFCSQSVLTASPASIRFDEPGCDGTASIGLYQHVGVALNGGDYWVVDSSFASDDGGHAPTFDDPGAFFGTDATVRLTPMVHTGNAYQPGATITVATPYEGDTVISPSSTLLVSRLASDTQAQRGYSLRKLVATHTPTGGYTIETTEIGRYCVQGAKPNFSFDERYMVTHHYVTPADAVELGFSGPNDPAFAAYKTEGASNLYLIDLVTGHRTRITKMKPGQYALFPHFRSDGWIYFLARLPGSTGPNREVVMASDAALVLSAAP